MKQVDPRFDGPPITLEMRTQGGQINWEGLSSKLVGVACGLVLAGMLVAGVWPFHSPKNQVTWSEGGKGLQVGRHGTILTSGKIKPVNVPADAPCSLEIWFQPARPWSLGTLISFYSPFNGRQFSLRQYNGRLAVQSDTHDRRYQTPITTLFIEDVLLRRRASFVTITSEGGLTSVYVDGQLAQPAISFPLSGRDLHGELVIANSARIDSSWSGLLRGLALYDEGLSPVQVVHHYETWTKEGRPDISENERATMVYLFDEGEGRVIHNQVPSGIDLYIPERFVVLHQAFLRPFWEEYEPTWGYCEDVLINIAGFVPFGFLVCAYFSLARTIKRPALVTILLGFMVSFTIESLQAFLPTRDSGTTDLITNTLGTCIGVGLYRLGLWRVLVAKIWPRTPSSKLA